MADEAGMDRVSPAGCVLRLLLGGIILVVSGAAGLIFYRTWLGEGLDIAEMMRFFMMLNICSILHTR